MPEQKNSPLISLIVCTYNRDKFLDDCLASISEQSLNKEHFEVILVNNNSTDGTADIIKKYEDRNYPNWRFFVEKQQGLSYARNRGMAEATA
ncbi:MAG: glycosyltransferase family A protein, partial [Cyanobacteria bacterium J06626_14]